LRFLLPDAKKVLDPSRKSKHYRLSLYLITLAGIIFRSELAVLLFTVTSFLFFTDQINIRKEILPAGLSATIIALLLTVPIDSFFWQQYPLWPELASFKFNLVSGNASSWGVFPVYYYFYSSLPRLLLNPLTYSLCIPIALTHPATSSHATSLLLPSLNFVVLYSLLPHKEWRFIVYVVPPITTAAALGASSIWRRRAKAPLYRLLSILLVTSVLASFALSTFVLLPISSTNYPGAQALTRLHTLAHGEKKILAIHMDNLACQTGVTHFLEKPPPQSLLFAPNDRNDTLWVYDKTEDEKLLLSPAFWQRFDYVLAERPEKVIGAWDVVDTIDGFAGVEILKPVVEGWLEGAVHKCYTEEEPTTIKMRLGNMVVRGYLVVETLVRKHVSKGWWVGIKVEPKIRILKRVKVTGRSNG
jgi:alpha-1,6-mannosyltransferase